GKTQELHAELISDKRDAKHTRKRNALKRIVANMTMGNDMLPLFADVVACLQIPMLEVKKMVYLYLIHYARSRPQLAADAISDFLRDLADPNPLIRALALRTMASIQTPQIIDSLQQPLARCLEDSDAYVAKTAALCVAKVWVQDRERIQSSGTLNLLHNLLSHENPNVVANALVALAEIYQRDGSDHLPQLVVEYSAMSKYLVALDEASEWSQAYILESILFVVPQSHADAEQLAERIVPRLQHANSGIVLTTIRVLAYLTHYI
ncbi:ARM repeat-containing protein, partial [Caulochytrium protostelioides]